MKKKRVGRLNRHKEKKNSFFAVVSKIQLLVDLHREKKHFFLN